MLDNDSSLTAFERAMIPQVCRPTLTLLKCPNGQGLVLTSSPGAVVDREHESRARSGPKPFPGRTDARGYMITAGHQPTPCVHPTPCPCIMVAATQAIQSRWGQRQADASAGSPQSSWCRRAGGRARARRGRARGQTRDGYDGGGRRGLRVGWPVAVAYQTSFGCASRRHIESI